MPIRVSTVIPVYNGQRFLERSLNALLAQTVRPSEIIIANDASTDDTPLIARAYKMRYPKLIRIIHNSENKGINWTLNRCIFKEVKNDYIFPTACDDLVLNDFIEKSLTALNMNPEAGICFSNTHNVQEQTVDEFLQKLKPDIQDSTTIIFYPPEELIKHIRQDLSIPTNTMIINRKFAFDAGGYIETLKWHADLMLAYVLAFRHGAVFIPQPIAVRTFREDSYSSVHVDIEKNIAIYDEFLALLRTRYKDCYEAFMQSNFFKIWHYRIAEGLIRTPSMWNVDNLRLCINQLLQWAEFAANNLYGINLENILTSSGYYLKNTNDPLKNSQFTISCLNALKTDIYELVELVFKNIPDLIEKGYSATALNILYKHYTSESYKNANEIYHIIIAAINDFISQAKYFYQKAIDVLMQANDYNTAQRFLEGAYHYFKDEVNVLSFMAFLYSLMGQKKLAKEFRLRAETFVFNSIFTPQFKDIEANLSKRR